MTNRLLALMQRGAPILTDGAMGTMLLAAGLRLGEPPELWNLLPDRRPIIRAIHQDYQAAGAQIILTNSFGANPIRLASTHLEHRTVELNHAATTLAREAIGPDVVVAGSMGPLGKTLAPAGPIPYETAVAAFASQAQGLAAGGADVLWLETMSDPLEVQAAAEGTQRAAPHLPLVATLSFHAAGQTASGHSPAQAFAALSALPLAAFGANCGNGPAEMEAVITALTALRPALPLVARSNAGLPQFVAGQPHYPISPALMADHARRLRTLGTAIIGACCGSTPAHIQAVAQAIKDPREVVRSIR
jgi:methionine synthase I (cobalamin-dependent)